MLDGVDHVMWGAGPKGHHCNINGIVHLRRPTEQDTGSMDPGPIRRVQIQDLGVQIRRTSDRTGGGFDDKQPESGSGQTPDMTHLRGPRPHTAGHARMW